MEQRAFDRAGLRASVIGLGTWQLGADWGDIDDRQAEGVLEAAAESGVTFFDTADVYGDGRSEQTIARFLRDRPDLDILVATKMGRRVDQIPENYVLDNFRAWNDRSRRNLGTDRIDRAAGQVETLRRLKRWLGPRVARTVQARSARPYSEGSVPRT